MTVPDRGASVGASVVRNGDSDAINGPLGAKDGGAGGRVVG